MIQVCLFKMRYCKLFWVITIYLFLFVKNGANANKTVEYLLHYGYLNEGDLVDDITPGVKLFQETYGLTVDGILNEETESLLDTPRCGNKDDLFPFTASPTIKWYTNEITWYMFGSFPQSILVERAFNVWSKHANITFKKRVNNPMIYLSSVTYQHTSFANKITCTSVFDGPGGVLAHASRPQLTTKHTDIHFDDTENWDYSMNLPGNGQSSFYLTAIHEIGHSLGLGHSIERRSIMWPYENTPVGISNLYEYDIDPDDINAIQFLYGRPINTTSTTTSSTTSTTTIKPTSSTTSTTTTTTTIKSTTPTKSTTTKKSTTTTKSTTSKNNPTTEGQNTSTPLDICAYRNQVNNYLVFKDKLYVLHNNLVWILSIDKNLRTREEYTNPKMITEWLTFLPNNFTKITAIYQRPNDEIVIVVGNTVYYIQTPYLTLIQQMHVQTLLGKPVRKINAAISNNQGKTFVFADDWYVIEINECSQRGTFLGAVISKIFPGIPNTLVNGFRYTNGKLYFQTGTTVLEYDEFKETVTRSVDDIFDFVGINCIRDSLLSKLYHLIKDFNK